MKAFVTLCGMGVVALAMTACNQAPPAAPDTHDADVKAIQDVETQSLQSWAAKDADKAAMFYADDAVVIAVGSSRVDLQACKLEYSIVSPK